MVQGRFSLELPKIQELGSTITFTSITVTVIIVGEGARPLFRAAAVKPQTGIGALRRLADYALSRVADRSR